MESNRALTHFGIPGMKWGVRRQKKLATSRKKTIDAMKYNIENQKTSKGGGPTATKKLHSFMKKFEKETMTSFSKKTIKNGEKTAEKIMADYGFGYLKAKDLDRGIRYRRIGPDLWKEYGHG